MSDFDRIVSEPEAILADEFSQGYYDGHKTDSPEPSSNRSKAYLHSFRVGRAEKNNKPIPAAVSRINAQNIRSEEIVSRLGMLT